MRKSLLIILMKPSILVGGQAVIEGVMMRVPGSYATAVRDPNGNIHIQKKEFTSITETSAFWKKPIFRGMASLYESMKMGMKTLNFSVDIAMPEEEPQSKIGEFFSTLFLSTLEFQELHISLLLGIILSSVCMTAIFSLYLNVDKISCSSFVGSSIIDNA